MHQSKGYFRPEIQGVRTVAALLVAIYHIWIGQVSGGVDVFFVISGYLITSSLMRQYEKHDRIRFGHFWANLIKRLFPAAMTVAAVIMVASIYLMPATFLVEIIREGVATVLYLENWQLARTSVDYLADRTLASPYQHYWALSVQGQFYLFWPFLIAFSVWLAHRLRITPHKSTPVILLIVFVVSLYHSITATSADQAFAYFDTFARMWEFAAGGLLVFLPSNLGLSNRVRAVLGWAGLVAIASCGLVLPVSSSFPGFVALWPVLGAIAVLVGANATPYGANRLLGSRAIVSLGDISYAFYLWHWPLFVFYRAHNPDQDPGFLEGGLLILAAGVLAWITTRFVERPIRRSSIGKVKLFRAYGLGVALCLPMATVTAAASGYVLLERKNAQKLAVTWDDPRYPGAAAMRGVEAKIPASYPLHPHPLMIGKSLPKSYFDGCHTEEANDKLKECFYGATDGDITIALVGGSHSTQWLPALDALGKKHGWKIWSMTRSICWFSLEERADNVFCRPWNQQVLSRLQEELPEFVFAPVTRAQFNEESVPESYLAMWREMDKLGIKVLGVRDNPWWYGLAPSDCASLFGGQSPKCRKPRSQFLAAQNPFNSVTDLPANVSGIDLTDLYCDEKECLSVVGNVLVYRDQHHFNRDFMLTMMPFLEAEMRQKAPTLFAAQNLDKP